MTATLSSHILDTHLGKPAQDILVTLSQIDDTGQTLKLAQAKTNADGRVSTDGWQFTEDKNLSTGRYTLTFDTDAYFGAQNITAFYPQVIIDFVITDSNHYHVPLLLSAYGYSTYRGS